MKWLVWPVVLVLAVATFGQQFGLAGTKWHYVLINDGSARTLWPGGTEQQATLATQFLKEVVQPRSDLGTLVSFNDKATIDVENSTNPDELAAKLIRHGRGGTAVYDSIVAAAEWLDKEDSTERQKIIFVFSDFDDDASYTSFENTISLVQRVHIAVIFIVPSVVERKTQGRQVKQLAKGTGGHAYFVGKDGSFDFAAMKHDLGR